MDSRPPKSLKKSYKYPFKKRAKKNRERLKDGRKKKKKSRQILIINLSVKIQGLNTKIS
jgi:hypothetical protein